MSVAELQTAIANTLTVMAITLAIALPPGMALAILLVRTDLVARKTAWIALGSQLAVPLYVFAGGWSAVFGFQGWLTSLGFGPGTLWTTELLGSTAALLAVCLIHALAALPWVVLIIALGLLQIDRNLEDQAWLDGGLGHVWRRAILPKLRIWIWAGLIWTAIPVMTEMVVTNLYQVPTLAEQVYLDASQGTVRPLTYVAAFFLCLAPLAVTLGLIVRRLPSWDAITRRDGQSPVRRYHLNRWRWPASALVWAAISLVVGLPIASLMAKAGWKPYVASDGTTGYGWTLHRFLTTIQESLTLFQSEFFWSAMLAVQSSMIALSVATGLYMSAGPILRKLISLFMILLLAVPGPLVGMLVIWGLNRSYPSWLGWLYDHTLAAPILAQQFRLLPLSWLLVYAIAASISARSWELASLDGLRAWERVRTVVWPQSKTKWLAAWLLLFVLSFGELSCTILVLPPGVTTVPMRLFEMLHFGMRHQDSGLCAILLLLGWLVSYTLWKTLNER